MLTALAARIAVRRRGFPSGIAAVAGGDRDFLDDARERFSALGVRGRLFMLNGGPFGMA